MGQSLEKLPAIAAAYGDGLLSTDQLRPLVRFASPESDAELAESARGWTAAHVAAVARQARPVTTEDTEDANRRRSLRFWWDEDRSLRLRGRLPEDEGAVVAKALERLAGQAPVDAETGLFERYDARCADALVQLA